MYLCDRVINMRFILCKMALANNFDKLQKGLFLLDYDGTLVEFTPMPEMATPSKRVLDLLKKLNCRVNTKVVIISGRGYMDMEKYFSQLPISIIAEHGAMIKNDGHWSHINLSPDSWKRAIYPMLRQFALSCPGSFIEEKEFSLVWHYRNALEIDGNIKSRELIQVLASSISSLGLKLLDGNKVIEIMDKSIGKGNATLKYIEENYFDYIVSIGDDKTDEEVFEVLSLNLTAETIKVGPGQTKAKHRLENVDEVLMYLEQIVSDTNN